MSYAPYPAYKDSGVPWLGQVPEGWEPKKIKYLVNYIGSGKTPRGGAEIYTDDGIMILRSQNVYDDGLRLKDVAYVTPEVEAQQINTRVQPADVLLNITGASIGRSTIVPGDLPTANVNQHVCIFRPQKTKIVPEFLHAFFCSSIGKEQVTSNENGTSREGLNFQQAGNLHLVLPPFEEQTAIADFLDKKTTEIDDLIAKKEELLRLLAEQRTALITHAVTKGLNLNAPMKPSGVVWFDQVPTHWQVRRLKDVGTLIGGAGFPHEFQNVQGEELFFYKVGDLGKSEDGIHLTSAPHTIDRETAAKLRAAVIPPDAILYAKIGAALLLNRRRISTANCCIDNNMTAWIVDPSKVLPLWGFYWMSTVDFGEHTNPGAVPSLSEGYQSILPITLPPLDEQQAIVDQLATETKAIDQTAKKIREAIERLQEYRTSIITSAVTGKIKVT